MRTTARSADGSKIRVREMMRIAGCPPPQRTLDGKDSCWAYHSQGGCSTLCHWKYDHGPSSPEDLTLCLAYAQKC